MRLPILIKLSLGDLNISNILRSLETVLLKRVYFQRKHCVSSNFSLHFGTLIRDLKSLSWEFSILKQRPNPFPFWPIHFVLNFIVASRPLGPLSAPSAICIMSRFSGEVNPLPQSTVHHVHICIYKYTYPLASGHSWLMDRSGGASMG